MRTRLIVRLPNWLGDTVMAVPALRALRAAYPGAAVLAAGPWTSVLAGQGLVDALRVYPRRWAGRLAAARTARAFDADVAVLLPNSFEAALAAVVWRVPRRIGFATGGRAWLLTDAPPLPSPRAHQVEEYLTLAAAAGAPAGDAVPRLIPPPEDAPERGEVATWLAALGGGEGPRAGIHLGAEYGDAKVWPAARVIELVERLGRRGVRPVLLGPPGDAGTAQAIVAATGVPSLVGRDRPGTLSALLAALDVVVAGDTGVAHLAAALGTPVVALFGPTDPALTAPRGAVAVVRHGVPCAPCSHRTCPIDHPCLRGVTADEVAASVDVLLRAASRR